MTTYGLLPTTKQALDAALSAALAPFDARASAEIIDSPEGSALHIKVVMREASTAARRAVKKAAREASFAVLAVPPIVTVYEHA